MSRISLSGDAAGTGTFTIASPNSNNNRTLTLPDNTGTLLTSATPVINQKGVPAFFATSSGTQSLTNNTETTVSFQTKIFDTTNAFNTSTFRFQPTVAGYYQFNWMVYGGGSVNTQAVVSRIVRDDGFFVYGSWLYNASGYNDAGATGSTLMYMNGTTNSVSIAVRVVVSGAASINSFTPATFSGVLISGA